MKIRNFKLLFLSFTLSIFISLKTNAQQVSSELKAQAEKGDAEAQFKMGKAYFGYQYGSPKKRAEAEKWLLMASEQGYEKATYLLSQLRFGKYECPIEILQKLAIEGYSEAQFSLGAYHQNYINDKHNDLSIAYKWMLLSAQDPDERYRRTWSLINHFNISHLEISKGQKMAKEHTEKYGSSKKSVYAEK